MNPTTMKRALLQAMARSKVEGATGSVSKHFTDGNVRSPEFNNAHQKVLQDDAGKSIAAKHLGLLQPEGKPTGPGYWDDAQGTWQNPTTEYPTLGDPGKQSLKAKLEQVFMAQDGVANTSAMPGLARRGQAGGMRMPGRPDPGGIRRQVEDAGLGLEFDNTHALSPGSEGLDIIPFADAGFSRGQQRQLQQRVPGMQPTTKPLDGSNAYHTGNDGGWSPWKSPATEFRSLMDDFDAAGETQTLDKILRETSGRAPGAYQEMESISGGKPRKSMSIIWKSLDMNKDKAPTEVIRKLIDDGKISKMEGMNYLQHQPEGLLA